ncbi:MAG: DUF2865 domain-containing protein [Burkholderiales bacterium]|nr:DUF2865 domain-containing protein [Burkholderiales bacterium]
MLRRYLSAGLGWLALLVPLDGALAQSAYCERLRGDIAALERAAGGGRSRDAAASIQRQRAELDRTVAYSRSIGCQRQRFLMFGEPPPPQCGQIEAQINRMASNLAALESQADRYGGGAVEAHRASLIAAYDATCRGLPPPTPARGAPGFFERLFGDQQEDPVTGMEPPPLPPEDFGLGGGAVKAICVRKCDGYYFPISGRTSRGALEGEQALCAASCPNAEVELFLQPADGKADDAVALDGTPYASLPNAFRYRRAYDSTCSCRRPGQSWSDALAEAERLVGTRRSDVVVTEEKAQELSRPQAPQAAPTPRASQPNQRQQRGTAAAPPVGPAAAPPLKPTVEPPTAPPQGSSPVATERREVIRPDGSRQNLRVVAPTIGPAPQPAPR